MEEKTNLMNNSKPRERRQIDAQRKRSHGNIKQDISQLASPQTFEQTLPGKKVLKEIDSIIKIGVENEMTAVEKDAIIKNSNETIDNLRKNIFHLQMEYEKLDQNFLREISFRSEIVKRMDTTRSILESAIQYCTLLSASVKQLENDKLKIAEFYELIYQGQKEVEEKYTELRKMITNLEDLLTAKCENIKKNQEAASQNSVKHVQLCKELSNANDKLKITSDENEKLLFQIHQLKENVKSLESSLEEQQKLNLLQEVNKNKLKFLLKNVKIQRIKYQRYWRNKYKKVLALKNRNKKLLQNIHKLQTSVNGLMEKNITLEKGKEEIISNLKQQLKSTKENYKNLDSQKENLLAEITGKNVEIEELNKIKMDLTEKNIEFLNKENQIKTELEQLQKSFSEALTENKKFKEYISELTQENKNKTKLITDLENKVQHLSNSVEQDTVFLKTESKKYQEIINDLRNQIQELQKKLAAESEQKQQILIQYEGKMEKIEELKTNIVCELQNEIKNKTSHIENLKKQMENIKQCAAKNEKSLLKLNSDNEEQKLENKGLRINLEKLKEENENLNNELKQNKIIISKVEKKLEEEKITKNELEINVLTLRKEIEEEKKSFEQLKQTHIKAENELSVMKKAAEENSSLKASVAKIQKRLEETEATVEAYKVVVKKLEAENNQKANKESEEISKLKFELIRLQDATKKDEECLKFQKKTPQKFPNDDSENERRATETVKTKGPATPLQTNKKFLSTPRKIYGTTQQSPFQSITPVKKKRDPYEFDSDSSIEHFDSDQVLRAFNNCQKKEVYKKPKNK